MKTNASSARYELPALVRAHPISRGDYTIQTPFTEQLLGQLEVWVLYLRTNVLIYGPSMAGKTKAIKVVNGWLRKNLGNSGLIYNLDMEYQIKVDRPGFYELLLKSVKHARFDTGTGSDKKNRLLEHLRVQIELVATETGDVPTVVFLVDEAQNLIMENYEILIHVYNEMELAGAHVCFLLFGLPSLTKLRETLEHNQKEQIVKRFMSETYDFHSVQDVTGMRGVLQSYDTTFFPKKSDWSYTRFFFPEAWDSGIKLIDLAETFFKRFLQLDTLRTGAIHTAVEAALRDPDPQNQQIEISMTHVTQAVNWLLRQYGSGGPKQIACPTDAEVRASVDITAFCPRPRVLQLQKAEKQSNAKES